MELYGIEPNAAKRGAFVFGRWHAVTAALEGYRALKDDAATKRLEDKARIFAKPAKKRKK